MTLKEAIDLLSEITMYCDFTDEYGDYINDEPYITAVDMAIKALEQTSHLIDRPCEACEFHKENGCCKWSCVFEEVNADEDRD